MTIPALDVLRLRLRWHAGPRGLSHEGHPTTAIRGALGTFLREHACSTGAPTCAGCPVQPTCAYGALFEPFPPPEGFPKRYNVPPPWACYSPWSLGSVTRPPGSPFDLQISLFGPARAFAHAVTHACADVLGSDPERCVVDGVDARDERLTPAAVDADPPPTVRVTARSPLEIKHQGALVPFVDPVAFTARLSERFDLLALAWGTPGRLDAPRLRAHAEQTRVVASEWHQVSFERTTRRATAPVPMRGLVGAFEVEGVSPELWSLWRCAPAVHVGGNAALGFGRVTVEAG
jgi:hypothetical protein